MILRDFSNNNDDAADCQEGSASVRNAADITATDHEEVSRLRQELKKLLELTTSNLNTSTSRKRRLLETTQRQKPCRLETTPARSPYTTVAGEHPTIREHGGSTRMSTRAKKGAVTPISR